MEYSESDIKQIIDIYMSKGIVTRKEWPDIDMRPYGRGLQYELEKRGIDNVQYTEGEVGNYRDYSGVLYDDTKYSQEEALEYLCNKVLSVD